jgi:hypothetical protein
MDLALVVVIIGSRSVVAGMKIDASALSVLGWGRDGGVGLVVMVGVNNSESRDRVGSDDGGDDVDIVEDVDTDG